MNHYVKAMEENLTEEGKHFLKSIYEPKFIRHGYYSAWNHLCVLQSGEIRYYTPRLSEEKVKEIYGDRLHAVEADSRDVMEWVYLSSTDCGISWSMHLWDRETLGLSYQSPKTGRWFRLEDSAESITVKYSDIGPDDKNYKTVSVPVSGHGARAPLFLESIDRIIVPFYDDYTDEKHKKSPYLSKMLYSDDNGESWKVSDIEKSALFEITPPHKGPRWEEPGIEPTVEELSDGTLMCLLRAATDYHFVSYSYDHGDTWTKPTESSFHAVQTTPTLFKMNDGRLLLIYNNTKPLPEQDKRKTWPPMAEDNCNGKYEDVFTNRDTNTIAVSEDDGKTFIGFREFILNPERNACDFRTSGGNPLRDKSVHQAQIVELPYGKILIHVGQHDLCSSLVILDTKWLYETTRHNDLQLGMTDFSTQVYLKSISGGWDKYSGHCAWNRTNGVVPVPDPSGDRSEVLFMRNTADPVLYNQRQGVVWNFPAAKKGEVTVRMNVLGRGARMSILDFWMNPCDPTVGDFADFTYVITKKDCGGKFQDITMKYDTEAGKCEVLVDGKHKTDLKIQASAPNGLCYLHLSTYTDKGDKKGTLIKEFDKK